MSARLQVRVVTPENPVYEGEADMVVVPAHDGEMGVLPRHARLLASLGIGTLRVHEGDNVHRWFLEGGFVQVVENRVTVICEQATDFEHLDVEAAEAQAEQARSQGRTDARQLTGRAQVMRRVLQSSAPH